MKKITNQYYGLTLLCLTSIVMVINYKTSNIVNYTVLDLQEINVYEEPQGMYSKILSRPNFQICWSELHMNHVVKILGIFYPPSRSLYKIRLMLYNGHLANPPQLSTWFMNDPLSRVPIILFWIWLRQNPYIAFRIWEIVPLPHLLTSLLCPYSIKRIWWGTPWPYRMALKSAREKKFFMVVISHYHVLDIYGY